MQQKNKGLKAEVKEPKKNRFKLLKRLIGLMAQGANTKQYYLEIGTHFLKKGTGYEVGQIVQSKRIGDNRHRVKVITGIFYDFATNKINHTAENRIIKK